MKRLFLMIFALLVGCFVTSCNDVHPCGGVPTDAETDNTIEATDSVDTTDEEVAHILVDWMDFVRVGGVVYDGGWENREVDESKIGEKLGEILYKVKSYYESEEELNQADKRDFTAAFRPIGCEIFAVKDDENSIAVLHNGKYYLYTRNDG